ncbi:MAG: DNA-directed RNA polymerase subunit alpha [Candidatus Eisenbacteria bacterium]|uniref:DNA-directed RNA polymerase subunit alpha n=1 Tax=Eiseniibacteriota bacterium TaxID=2212470 RepID=A0A948W3I9_UNCEI|nr:DNA-directed RNA polymerase subunit alpha [Candidatus Eisenbacteria bacterium]MBU1950614.1 DNA-directed RNA polymerase subunit alpha [Candidatus Eisenbacteria bacterium]MBU2691147.1 DNA-directed RNA polymerase subunit alpha [Candidatus Eisenbacteria bacterium]
MKWKILQMPEGIEHAKEESTATYGKFVVEPLERGFGLTLGNALRRVLMSSLQGVAVTACRIAGARHEFNAIPGVVEDAAEIVLNLKQVRFKHKGDGPRTGFFRRKGQGVITAGDLEIAEEIEVLNPEQHIATVSDDIELEIEVRVSSGRGYTPAEVYRDRADGSIPMDAVFSPITRAHYTVEKKRIGQRIDFDRLVIEIWTDGSILPQDSLAMAAKVLRDHLNLFIKFEEAFEEEEETVVDEEFTRIKILLERPVEELELSVRSGNCLRSAKIASLGDLVQKSEAEMLQYKNFGKKSLQEIKEMLQNQSLHFSMDVSKYLGVGSSTKSSDWDEDVDEYDDSDVDIDPYTDADAGPEPVVTEE